MGLEPKINLSNIQGLICQGLQLLEGCMWSTQEGGKEGGRERWMGAKGVYGRLYSTQF